MAAAGTRPGISRLWSGQLASDKLDDHNDHDANADDAADAGQSQVTLIQLGRGPPRSGGSRAPFPPPDGGIIFFDEARAARIRKQLRRKRTMCNLWPLSLALFRGESARRRINNSAATQLAGIWHQFVRDLAATRLLAGQSSDKGANWLRSSSARARFRA